MPPRPVALTGFMGVGKTTAGRLAAARLGRPFHDTDELVEAQAGMSVPDLFRTRGEPHFRRLEATVVAELLEAGPSVIALGGGALLDADSRRRLLEGSLLIHLDAPWEEMQPEVAVLARTRPLLAGRDGAALERLFRERRELYGCAHVSVAAPRTGAAAVAEAIVQAVREREGGGG